MLVTTYKHDYVPPSAKPHDLCESTNTVNKTRGECQCIEDKIDISNIAQKQSNVEWTGVAPMGHLIDPRIIPTKFHNDQLVSILEGQTDCFKEQPNRFLKILRTEYPDLYQHLKQMPKNELNRRLERDRMYTTYQVDFCNINEYPEGIYKSLKVEDETSKLNASKLLSRKEACADLRTSAIEKFTKDGASEASLNADSCEKNYKPFSISFADSSRFINSGNSSHWRSNIITKKANFSEYMDTINKIGCVIIKNNIHNHQKCTAKNCRHQLTHGCVN